MAMFIATPPGTRVIRPGTSEPARIAARERPITSQRTEPMQIMRSVRVIARLMRGFPAVRKRAGAATTGAVNFHRTSFRAGAGRPSTSIIRGRCETSRQATARPRPCLDPAGARRNAAGLANPGQDGYIARTSQAGSGLSGETSPQVHRLARIESGLMPRRGQKPEKDICSMALPEFSLRQLLEAGVHFGHQTQRWNPRMGEYIYGDRNGIHILDLTQTVPLLDAALNVIRETVAKNGRILFVGTKRQAQRPIAEAAERCAQYYMNHRWLGGTLTNWKTVSQSIGRLKAIDEQMAEGAEGLTKKERLGIEREQTKLEASLGGIREMGGVPDL